MTTKKQGRAKAGDAAGEGAGEGQVKPQAKGPLEKLAECAKDALARPNAYMTVVDVYALPPDGNDAFASWVAEMPLHEVARPQPWLSRTQGAGFFRLDLKAADGRIAAKCSVRVDSDTRPPAKHAAQAAQVAPGTTNAAPATPGTVEELLALLTNTVKPPTRIGELRELVGLLPKAAGTAGAGGIPADDAKRLIDTGVELGKATIKAGAPGFFSTFIDSGMGKGVLERVDGFQELAKGLLKDRADERALKREQWSREAPAPIVEPPEEQPS
jgi:hypothetical protein